ncbi:hypothetical protein TWF696_002452 [Orbilia brochopaga]|uniref:Uncharacterized protein n=1 Tax=Orbilia brochopaga TaxID=3140254 RepID=A0AAV9U561_9PEZI
MSDRVRTNAPWGPPWMLRKSNKSCDVCRLNEQRGSTPSRSHSPVRCNGCLSRAEPTALVPRRERRRSQSNPASVVVYEGCDTRGQANATPSSSRTQNNQNDLHFTLPAQGTYDAQTSTPAATLTVYHPSPQPQTPNPAATMTVYHPPPPPQTSNSAATMAVYQPTQTPQTSAPAATLTVYNPPPPPPRPMDVYKPEEAWRPGGSVTNIGAVTRYEDNANRRWEPADNIVDGFVDTLQKPTVTGSKNLAVFDANGERKLYHTCEGTDFCHYCYAAMGFSTQ